MTDAQKRDAREWRAANAMRKSKRGRVHIERKSTRILNIDGVKCRVQGSCIIVRPLTHSKDRRKAFLHFCQKNRIGLVSCEWTDYQPPGCDQSAVEAHKLDWSRATAFMAFGSPDALKLLTEHAYVGSTRWDYATTFRGGYSKAKLAIHRHKGKDDVPKTDMSGTEALKEEQEEIRGEVSAWIAQNIEDGPEEQITILRAYLTTWFLKFAEEPDSIEELCEYVDSLDA